MHTLLGCAARSPRCYAATATATARAADGDPTVIFKDLDVDMRIVLEQAAHEQLMSQLKADCQLLK